MAFLSAMAGVWVLGAASIETRVPADVPCVSQAELRQALDGTAAPRSAVVSVMPAPDAKLLLRVAWGDGQKIERRVPVDAGDCGAVKRVVATLIRTWLEHPPPPGALGQSGAAVTDAVATSLKPPASKILPSTGAVARNGPATGAVLPTATTAPPTGAADGAAVSSKSTSLAITTPLEARASARAAPPSDVVAEAASSSQPPLAAADEAAKATPDDAAPVAARVTQFTPPPDDVARTPAPVAAAASPATPATRAESPATVVASPGAPPAQARRSWALTAAVLGGVSGGPTPTAVPTGQLAVELDITRFGAGVDLGLEGTRTVAGAHGSAFVSQSWLTLAGKFRQPLNRWLAVTALLGVRGFYIRAGANGFTTTRTAELFGAGPALSLGAEATLGPVTVMLRAVGALRFPSENLVIDGLGDVMTLKIGQACLIAGLGWRF
jgi:hypothetical protein